MPVGSWFSNPFTSGSRSSSSGSLTGTGTASQPKAPAGPTPLGGQQLPGTLPTPTGLATPPSYTGGGTWGIGPPSGQWWAQAAQQAMSADTTPSLSPLAGAQALATAQYGPQSQILADTLARQQAQIGMVGLDTDYRTAALRRDNALAQQGLGLDRAALGNDSNLTKTQLANLDRLRTLLKKQYGLAGETLANQLTGLKVDEDKARDLADRSIWDLRSDLTRRGAFNTIANERGTGRVKRDLDYQLRGIDVNRQGANIAYRGNIVGLDEKGIGYDNQAAGLNAKLTDIGINTQRLDISQQQLSNSLEDGLYQIGLQGQVSLNGLLDAISGTNTQQAQLAGTILQQVLSYSSLPPDVLAQLTAALGLSGAGAGATPRAPSGSADPSRLLR